MSTAPARLLEATLKGLRQGCTWKVGNCLMTFLGVEVCMLLASMPLSRG